MAPIDVGVLLSCLLLAAAAAASSLRGGASRWSLSSEVAAVVRPNLITASASKLRSPTAAADDLQSPCTFDHSGLDDVLHAFVKPPRTVEGVKSSLFDYKALHASSDHMSKLRGYVESLASFKPSCLSMDGKLAFWANVYNALIINLVVSDFDKSGQLPKSWSQDYDGNVWGREAGTVAGEKMSLEEVLIQARQLGDPRIHAVVNCASLSCPDLRAGAYSAENMQTQLDTQVKLWLTNPTKGAKVEGHSLEVSPIFKWHSEDFADLSDFVAGPLGLSSSSVEVSGFLPYNWDLNDVKNESE